MKPRLLITLGCSWTFGQGVEDVKNHSWPAIVSKHLGFDKLINFGLSGASNSGRVKKFYDFIERNPHLTNSYEVLVIWLMTHPIRFSFYQNNKIQEYHIGESPNEIERAYLNQVDDINKDAILEQKFYLSTLENLCKVNNIDLIVTSWVNDSYQRLHQIHGNKEIHLYKDSPRNINPPKDDSYYSPCKHPNEKGYQYISQEIINGIKINHPKWYGNKKNDKVVMEWLGDKTNYKFI